MLESARGHIQFHLQRSVLRRCSTFQHPPKLVEPSPRRSPRAHATLSAMCITHLPATSQMRRYLYHTRPSQAHLLFDIIASPICHWDTILHNPSTDYMASVVVYSLAGTTNEHCQRIILEHIHIQQHTFKYTLSPFSV